MAISRQDALKRLNGLAAQVQEHLKYLAEEPESVAFFHWKNETENWLNQMEAVLPHVGKKTSAHWAEQIARWRHELEN